jgi:N-acyl-D-aspartate/D-glutamate deacylase
MRRRGLVPIGAWIVVVVSLVGCSDEATEDFDILIRNGRIVDGTGAPAFHGDIGIIDDTVSPGFIDVHTHCDYGLGRPGSNVNLNYLIQGVTTVVTGNCGAGTFEIADTKAQWEEQGIGTNAVHLVGFGDVRRAVMGTEPRESEPEELEKMRSILRQAMREGAWGMSTGLDYVPDRYSTTEEIIQATKVVAEFGGIYASHQRNEFDRVPEATRETIRVAEGAGVRALVSHLKVCRKNAWGMMREVVEVINDARARGVDIAADMYPYHFAGGGPIIPIATNSGWSPFHLPTDLEPFAALRKRMADTDLQDAQKKELRKQYVEELARALSDDSKRRQIRQSVLVGSPHQLNPVAVGGWDSYLIVVAEKNADLVGRILSDIAEEQKRDPFDVAADLVIDEPGLYVACGVMSEDDMRHAMEQEWLMFSSDGDAVPMIEEADGPVVDHPRAFGSQTRVLRKFVREEKILTLENAIRKMTSLPARFLRMEDRGHLVQGYRADVVIFDPETVRDSATHADARQYSTGVETVIVGGEISIENGAYNGALNGKLLLLTENRRSHR